MEYVNFSITEGKRLNSINRAIDMLCLNIGENIELTIWGEKEKYPEYSLHVQCPWALIDNETIVLGSSDIYEPYDENVEDDWNYDEIGRNDKESSIFDVKSRELEKVLSELVIEYFSVDNQGNIKIKFTKGWSFQTFIASSKKEEFWRFINYCTQNHFVFYDN